MNYAFIRKEKLSDPPSVSTVARIFILDIISLIKYERWELKSATPYPCSTQSCSESCWHLSLTFLTATQSGRMIPLGNEVDKVHSFWVAVVTMAMGLGCFCWQWKYHSCSNYSMCWLSTKLYGIWDIVLSILP